MKSKTRSGIFQRMLNWTEKAGNALPHPATLFALFALAALLLSASINMLMGRASAKWAILAPIFHSNVYDNGILS